MNDLFDNEITVGDTVALIQPGYKNLIMGEVLAMGKKVHVRYKLDEHPRSTYKWPKDLVVKN